MVCKTILVWVSRFESGVAHMNNFPDFLNGFKEQYNKMFGTTLKKIQRLNWELDEIIGEMDLEEFLRRHPEADNMTVPEMRRHFGNLWKFE